MTSLHDAVRAGNIQLVETLLAAGDNPNARDCFDRTPMHVAAAWYHRAIAEILVRAGARVNVSDKYEQTPLMLAEKYEPRSRLGSPLSTVELLQGSQP